MSAPTDQPQPGGAGYRPGAERAEDPLPTSLPAMQVRRRAVRNGWIAAVLAAPLLYGLWWFITAQITIWGGGSLVGGVGASPREATTWWSAPLIGLAAVLALAADIHIGVDNYRRTLSKHGGSAKNSTPR
jgi:hypothetical protein